MEDSEQQYSYSNPSALSVADGVSGLFLATSGGISTGGSSAHPAFFRGFLDRPDQAAAALLACARVARTRFYMLPSMVAANIRAADPVATSNEGTLRFESFSSCCGVYSRFDVLPESLDGEVLASGTTNVDFNPPMREALTGVASGEPLHLEVGRDELTVTTLDASVVERRVPLPRRWLKGFAEVQVLACQMTPRIELSAIAARRFLRSLPRTSRGPIWIIPNANGVRISSKPSHDAVCVGGPERLRWLEPLLRFSTGLKAYGPEVELSSGPLASSWELALNGSRFTVVLSPEPSRGFSGEGGVLYGLADEVASDDADLIGALLAWEPRVDIDGLANDSGLDPGRVRQALGFLSGVGRVGYDLATAKFFHRELPYEPEVLQSMHPRLTDARQLVESEAIELTEDGGMVASGDVIHRVVLGGNGAADRCTCPWWGKYGGTRGPCKHVLAVRLQTMEGPSTH